MQYRDTIQHYRIDILQYWYVSQIPINYMHWYTSKSNMYRV